LPISVDNHAAIGFDFKMLRALESRSLLGPWFI